MTSPTCKHCGTSNMKIRMELLFPIDEDGVCRLTSHPELETFEVAASEVIARAPRHSWVAFCNTCNADLSPRSVSASPHTG